MGHLNRGFEQALATTRRWKGVHLEKTKSLLAFLDHPVNFCQDRLRWGDVTREAQPYTLSQVEKGRGQQCTMYNVEKGRRGRHTATLTSSSPLVGNTFATPCQHQTNKHNYKLDDKHTDKDVDKHNRIVSG